MRGAAVHTSASPPPPQSTGLPCVPESLGRWEGKEEGVGTPGKMQPESCGAGVGSAPPGGWGAAPALSALVHGECSQCRELVGLRNRGKGGCGGRGLAPDSDLKLSGSRLFPSNPAWIPHTEPECQFTALSPAPFP